MILGIGFRDKNNTDQDPQDPWTSLRIGFWDKRTMILRILGHSEDAQDPKNRVAKQTHKDWPRYPDDPMTLGRSKKHEL